MLKIKEIVRPQSLEEAYELNQKRTNRILGGMLWMYGDPAGAGTS